MRWLWEAAEQEEVAAEEVEVVTEEVEVVAEEVEGVDEVVVEEMSGSQGSGQVMSLHSSEQNSLSQIQLSGGSKPWWCDTLWEVSSSMIPVVL